MTGQIITWMVFTVLQCISFASVQAINLTNATPKQIPVDVFCKNNTGILCTMMYKYGGCCTSFRVRGFTITLSDTRSGNTSSRFQHGGIVPDTDKKTAVPDLNDAQVSLQPAPPKTTTPTCRNNTAIVQCNCSFGLYQASKAGDLRRVQLIISKGLEDINCRGKYKRTPVMVAVRKGHEKVFDFLVSHCCNLYSVDNHNNTVINVACKGGNTVIVKKLINNGYFDVDVRGSHGKTPLMHATLYGHIGVLKILIGKGSNVKTRDINNNNILHVACWQRNVAMVQYILRLNIDGVGIESKGCKGRTPVLSAVYHNQKRVTEFLVSQGCNLSVVDDDGDNIFHYACIKGDVGIVTYIISLGTGNEKRKNKYGHTPVQLAELHGHSSIAALLRDRQNVKT